MKKWSSMGRKGNTGKCGIQNAELQNKVTRYTNFTHLIKNNKNLILRKIKVHNTKLLTFK